MGAFFNPSLRNDASSGICFAVAHTRAKGDPDGWLVRAGRAANRLFTRVYHRLEVISPPVLPRRGAGILVCNHTSGLDPLLIQSACRRTIIWMMAQEYYQMRSLNWMFRRIDAIPVGREGRDATATRGALRALKQGRIVGIFPEGRIERTRELMPFQTGAALMAIRTGVPIYPAFLDGTQRNREMRQAFAVAHSATLAFGPPLQFAPGDPDRDDLEAANERIQRAVQRLMEGFSDKIFVDSRKPDAWADLL